MYTKYFIELKNRFFFLLLSCFSFAITGYYYKKILLFLVLKPTHCETGILNYFVFTNITEIFSSYLNVIIFFTFHIFLLFLVYHTKNFLSPSLFRREYESLKYIIRLILVVWLVSIGILNYCLFPLVWDFFLSFHQNSGVSLYFEAKLIEYLNFYITFYVIFVLYCQVFTCIIFFLNYLNADTIVIKKFRKIFYFFLVLFSTLISPPDISSQLLISLHMIWFFELLVLTILLKYSMSLIR